MTAGLLAGSPQISALGPVWNGPAHVYGHPEVNIDRVLVKAVYLRPSERAESPGWQADAMNILPRIEAFHNQAFFGHSKLHYALYGPVVGGETTSQYRAD